MITVEKSIDHYAMDIQWSLEDGAFLVKVPALPGCVTHGSTYEEAEQQGKDAIESWLEASRAWEEQDEEGQLRLVQVEPKPRKRKKVVK